MLSGGAPGGLEIEVVFACFFKGFQRKFRRAGGHFFWEDLASQHLSNGTLTNFAPIMCYLLPNSTYYYILLRDME